MSYLDVLAREIKCYFEFPFASFIQINLAMINLDFCTTWGSNIYYHLDLIQILLFTLRQKSVHKQKQHFH